MKVINIIHLGDNKNCNKERMLILPYVLFPTLRIFHLKLLENVWPKSSSAKNENNECLQTSCKISQ